MKAATETSAGPDPVPPNMWVLHRGALGDSVLLWPRLRHRARSGVRVELITDRAKAALAQRELGIVGVDAEQPRYNDLWRADAVIEPISGAGLVVDHVSSADAPAFRANLTRMFPGARVIHRPPPRGGREARAWVDAHPLAAPAPYRNPDGAFLFHVGAGSPAKRWPLSRWAELVCALGNRGPVRCIAGEVERDQLLTPDRNAFESLGGRYVDVLIALADALRDARLVIACDSGPAHLAAQLGVPTLALFGPTDPALWAPVGPCVDVLAPPDKPCGMDWLDARTVAAAATRLFTRTQAGQ